MKRDECFRALARFVKDDDIVIGTYTSAFEWDAIKRRPLNLIAIGAMGMASSHGLGLALGRPDKRVLVLDGDGSLLMNLGSLVTIASAAPPNLIHFVANNGTYEANGGHAIPNRGQVSFQGLARAAGFPNSYSFSALPEFEKQIAGILALKGPTFVELQIEPGAPVKYDYGFMHGDAHRATFKAALKQL